MKVICVLIDVEISGDRNVIKKEAEKILKYKDLAIENWCMWNVTAEVIPVITGPTDTILKTLREQHTGKSRNQETKKSSHVGTAHKLRKVLL